ncbi:MAG: B12-binding domain-containing radical SAM protein [Acidobacteriia bacterium]|nr:B12-binding domain-containing radical SAM protein [Terriglobia bacterium]
MKVCLISAPTANRFDNWAMDEKEAARVMGELAPVGILSLAAVLEAKGLHPEVVDLNRVYYDWLQKSNRSQSSAETDFCRFAGDYFAGRDFDFFGFSTVCSSYPLTLRIAAEVKRAHRESVVVLGGPQASVVDVSTMRAFPFVDLVVRGEAEQTLPDLVDALTRHSSLATISGITFRRDEDGEIVRTAAAPLVSDLDALPFPAFHLFPDVRFCRHFPLELGRGCPFACTFCSTNDFFRRSFRLKSPAQMIADMRRVKQTYGINSFELVHDMFTVDRKRVVAFCEALLGSKEEFTWGCSARTDCVDEELIELMAKAGCRGIFFGIETGSRRMQKIIDKGLELNDSAERVRSCDKFKISTAVSLMAGFPDETMNDLRDTAAFFVDSLRYDYADPQLSILAPLADTPIQKQHKDSLVLNDDVADMSYRGWQQQPEDHAMIAAHPEIFSSFYSVPLPHIEREFLKELRDFLLNGMRAFRRLLLGLHQDSGNVVDVFQQWQEWRTKNGVHFSEGDRTAYYAQSGFPADFFQFVRLHYIPAASKAPLAITALAEYEAALLGRDHESDHEMNAIRQNQEQVSGDISADNEKLLSPDSRLQLRPGVNVIQLPADYQEIVRRLRQRSPLHDVPNRPVKLAIRRTPLGPAEVRQLTPLSAELLDLCEGGLTVQEIAGEFLLRNIEIPGVTPEKACLAGIEMLRQQRLIALA